MLFKIMRGDSQPFPGRIIAYYIRKKCDALLNNVANTKVVAILSA